jgi:hypothetical protein
MSPFDDGFLMMAVAIRHRGRATAIVSGKMAGRHPAACTEPNQAGQHLVAEGRQFVEIIDE